MAQRGRDAVELAFGSGWIRAGRIGVATGTQIVEFATGGASPDSPRATSWR